MSANKSSVSPLGIQPVPLQTITNENPAGPSLGTIPQARFLLVMLNMLTLQHGANTLNLLLNSGMLALTQTTLRLIGMFATLAGLLFLGFSKPLNGFYCLPVTFVQLRTIDKKKHV